MAAIYFNTHDNKIADTTPTNKRVQYFEADNELNLQGGVGGIIVILILMRCVCQCANLSQVTGK